MPWHRKAARTAINDALAAADSLMQPQDTLVTGDRFDAVSAIYRERLNQAPARFVRSLVRGGGRKRMSEDQVRLGQVRRHPVTGNAIRVEKIDDGGVHGSCKPAGVPGFSVWELKEFSTFPLLQDPETPRWRVTGELPWSDAAAEIYARIGAVVKHGSHELAKAGPRQVVAIDVVAPDAEAAKRRVAEISVLVGKALTSESLRAEPAPD